MGDERLAELLPRATQWLETGCHIQQSYYGNKSSYKLDVEDIDKVNVMFPLCMRQLHRMLRQRHRLGHTARVCMLHCIQFITNFCGINFINTSLLELLKILYSVLISGIGQGWAWMGM